MLALPLFALAASTTVRGATYALSDTVVGAQFNTFFEYQNIADPTHGRVNYVNHTIATTHNLTYASSDTFVLRADYTSVLDPNGPGRMSVRLMSEKQYRTHVAVFDVRHMPQGCGTWPAVWEVGDDWPNQGEVDIIEGVNDQSPNQATLHTNAGCAMPAVRAETGTTNGNDCDVATTDNTGCGVRAPGESSYGPTFNDVGGGWYVLERTNSAIKVWFWPRAGGGVPPDVSSAGGFVDTDNWGTPMANFTDTECNIAEHFGAHNVIINLTFCGDWAGAVYASVGCPGSCVDYVNENPEAFEEAYFDFAGIYIYE